MLEAAAIGLLTRSVPAASLGAAMDEIIDGVCRCSPPAVRRTKRFKSAAEGMSTRDAMAEAVRSISAGLLEDDTRQRIAAFLAKRSAA